MYSTAISSSVSALTTVLVKYEKKKNKIFLWFSGIDGMGHCNINKWICFCQSVSPSYLSFVILYRSTMCMYRFFKPFLGGGAVCIFQSIYIFFVDIISHHQIQESIILLN